jgi:aminopeptidase N
MLGQPAELVMRSFIEQPGVPVIAFEPQCDVGMLVLRQRRSLANGQTDPAKPLWHVPVCFRYGDANTAHETCTLVESPEVSTPVQTCPTWIVPNRDARGYYRSAIDLKLVQPLLDARGTLSRIAKANATERIMMVADLRAAVSRGELSIDQLLPLAPTLINDTDPKIARWALEAASFRADALDENLYQLARGWQSRSFGMTARRLRWIRATYDSEERHQLRVEVVPLIARTDPTLGSLAERLADKWLDKRNGLEDDIVDAVLDIAAQRGGTARFDKYLEAAKKASDRTEQGRLLRALGGFTDPALAKRALELTLGTELDLRESKSILSRMVTRRETRDLALDFIEKHIGALLPRMRDDEATYFMGNLAGAFCDPERRRRAADILTPRAAKISGAQAAVARGLEKSEQCIAELARQLPDLQAFLKR